MGVDRSDYVLIGVNIIDFIKEKLNDSFYEDEENENYLWRNKHEVGSLVYLDDGYCNEYFIVGVPIKFDDDGYSGIGLVEFDFSNLSDEYFDYTKVVKNHLKERFNIDNVIPSLIVLTHWT